MTEGTFFLYFNGVLTPNFRQQGVTVPLVSHPKTVYRTIVPEVGRIHFLKPLDIPRSPHPSKTIAPALPRLGPFYTSQVKGGALAAGAAQEAVVTGRAWRGNGRAEPYRASSKRHQRHLPRIDHTRIVTVQRWKSM